MGSSLTVSRWLLLFMENFVNDSWKLKYRMKNIQSNCYVRKRKFPKKTTFTTPSHILKMCWELSKPIDRAYTAPQTSATTSSLRILFPLISHNPAPLPTFTLTTSLPPPTKQRSRANGPRHQQHTYRPRRPSSKTALSQIIAVDDFSCDRIIDWNFQPPNLHRVINRARVYRDWISGARGFGLFITRESGSGLFICARW